MSSQSPTLSAQKDAAIELMPKLRFPEFRGAEGWKPSVLADACDMQAGKFVSATKISERNQSGLFPCYGGNGLRGYTTTHTHDGSYPLIGRQGALCGNVRLVSGQFHATEHAVVATPKEEIHIGWLNYALDLLNLNRFATGQAQPGLSIDVLENVALTIAPLESEQQKIANCLSSLDDLITAQVRKVDALKTHKKGLMQQLFPLEGETQPRLRFPEFREARGWEPTTLENLCTAKISYGIVQAGPHVQNGMPYIKSTDLNSELCLDKLSRTSEAIAQKYRRSEVVLGDIVFSLRGNIGIARIVPKSIPVANLTQGTARIRTKEQPEFYFYGLQSPSVHSRILAVAKGSTFQEISLEALRNIHMYHPKRTEQHRIASCLTNLDTQITTENQKLETLKTHKKGLMQQLFPSPEEAEQ